MLMKPDQCLRKQTIFQYAIIAVFEFSIIMASILKDKNILYLHPCFWGIVCGCGGIGRRARLRI